MIDRKLINYLYRVIKQCLEKRGVPSNHTWLFADNTEKRLVFDFSQLHLFSFETGGSELLQSQDEVLMDVGFNQTIEYREKETQLPAPNDNSLIYNTSEIAQMRNMYGNGDARKVYYISSDNIIKLLTTTNSSLQQRVARWMNPAYSPLSGHTQLDNALLIAKIFASENTFAHEDRLRVVTWETKQDMEAAEALWEGYKAWYRPAYYRSCLTGIDYYKGVLIGQDFLWRKIELPLAELYQEHYMRVSNGNISPAQQHHVAKLSAHASCARTHYKEERILILGNSCDRMIGDTHNPLPRELALLILSFDPTLEDYYKEHPSPSPVAPSSEQLHIYDLTAEKDGNVDAWSATVFEGREKEFLAQVHEAYP